MLTMDVVTNGCRIPLKLSSKADHDKAVKIALMYSKCFSEDCEIQLSYNNQIVSSFPCKFIEIEI